MEWLDEEENKTGGVVILPDYITHTYEIIKEWINCMNLKLDQEWSYTPLILKHEGQRQVDLFETILVYITNSRPTEAT